MHNEHFWISESYLQDYQVAVQSVIVYLKIYDILVGGWSLIGAWNNKQSQITKEKKPTNMILLQYKTSLRAV